MLEEELRRPVEERMPRKLAASDYAHQLEVYERLDDRIDCDAADLLDLALGNGLAVCDDRKRLERGAPEARGAVELQKRAHVASARGIRLEAVCARSADQLESDLRAVKLLCKALKRLVDFTRRACLEDLHQLCVVILLRLDGTDAALELVCGKRVLRREKKRAYDGLQRRWQRDPRALLLRDGSFLLVLGCRIRLLSLRSAGLLRRRSLKLLVLFLCHLDSLNCCFAASARSAVPFVRDLKRLVDVVVLRRQDGYLVELGVLVHDHAVLAYELQKR